MEFTQAAVTAASIAAALTVVMIVKLACLQILQQPPQIQYRFQPPVSYEQFKFDLDD